MNDSVADAVRAEYDACIKNTGLGTGAVYLTPNQLKFLKHHNCLTESDEPFIEVYQPAAQKEPEPMKILEESVTPAGLLLAVSTDAGIDLALSGPTHGLIGAISVSWDTIRSAMPAGESPIEADARSTIHVDARELEKIREVIDSSLYPTVTYMEGEMGVMRKEAADFSRNAIGIADSMISKMLGEPSPPF